MDRDVLAQLYERYYQPALFYLLALCRDRHLAEDLVQEAFVRAYLSLPEDVPSFPYWLMRVCRNLLCDHRRKRRRHADGDPPERADGAPTPEARRPLSEIAQLTGMTPGAAKTRLYRARRHLRREMEEDGYGL